MSTGTPLPSDPATPRIPLTSRTTARPLPEEVAQARQWVSARFGGLSGPDGIGPAGSSTAPLFSFVYGGQPSAQLLTGWPVSRQSADLDEHRVQHTLTWHDLDSGLVVRCEGVAWKAYPIVEWTVHLRNDGSADTPIIESLQTIDTVFQRGPEGEFLLITLTEQPGSVLIAYRRLDG